MKKIDASVGGYTDSRGEWRPEKPIAFAPIFTWPPKIKKFLIWLFNYLFSWNLIYLGIVLLSYNFLQPPLETMKTFNISWISILFIRNMAMVWIVYGGWHLYLYKFKKRGQKAKYCPRWQSENGSTFLWNDQVYDNVFWACASAVPIWTAFEVFSFWMYANGKLPYLDFNEHPVYFVLAFLLIPFWRELHFYVIHRLIHWKPLYKSIHYLHHYNINPGPWSGLAMHPVEHLLYFSVVLIHWVVPSHPLHFLFNSQHTALTPAPGHSGFEGKLAKFFAFGSYFHYLHHRMFECNYGESTIPLDKWFGIFEDGAQTQREKIESASTYQKFEVTKIIDETPDVKSFYLSSAESRPLDPNIPGQHLTFKIPFIDNKIHLSNNKAPDSQIKYAIRSYTISNNCENNTYRISIKKEKGGQVSSALHGAIKVGDQLEAKGPKGGFILEESRKKSNVFIAAGIGITPIISMLKSMKKMKMNNYLFISVKGKKHMIFKDEILNIHNHHSNLKVHVFFSQEQSVQMAKDFPSWGFYHKRLDIADLKSILSRTSQFDTYICGPEKMTTSLIDKIGKWKGDKSKIHTEIFGVQLVNKERALNEQEIQIHFSKSNKTLVWDHNHQNILEFAESNDISLEAGCMFGECGACSTGVEKGNVEYNFQTAAKPGKGNCLPCSCVPVSDIILEA